MLECPTHGTALLTKPKRLTLRLLYLDNQPSYQLSTFDGGCPAKATTRRVNLGTEEIERTTQPLLWLPHSLRHRHLGAGGFAR